MNIAIARGGNDCRHEVDFGDHPFEFEVTASAQNVAQPRPSRVGKARRSRQLSDGSRR